MSNEEGTFWIDKEKNELVLKNAEQEDRFYIEQEFEIESKKYLILVSTDDDKDEAMAFKLMEDEETLAVIEDDEEFERVREKYMSIQ